MFYNMSLGEKLTINFMNRTQMSYVGSDNDLSQD